MERREIGMSLVHERYVFPVGHGGFAGEKIGNFVVAYDCGSLSSTSMVENCVDHASEHVDHVDLLFISHFDNDHVNGLRYLLSQVKVKNAVVAWIKPELRAAYGVYTNGAYAAIIGLLRGDDVNVDEIGSEEREEETYGVNDIWEWIARSMMTVAEFNSIIAQMQAIGVDVPRLTKDPYYLENQKENINTAFKDVFGAKGPNTKGLIMLSQRCKDVKIQFTELFKGCWCHNGCGCCFGPQVIDRLKATSCLYVGDADLKNGTKNQLVQDFLKAHLKETMLLLMQIPHHGSQYNIGSQFETDFPAHYYFVNDVDTKRLQKSPGLFKSLIGQKKLIVSREKCQNLIGTRTVM